MKKDYLLKLKKMVYLHRLQIILLVLAFVIIINIVSVSAIVYKKKHTNPIVVYENRLNFLTIYNNAPLVHNDQKEEVKKEEKPIIIKKGKINDKEDGEKKYTDASMSNAKESNIYDAISLYETSGTSVGIDVSKYQGNINWKQVKDSGVEFAIIRCGYRGYGSGEILMDPYFEKNISGALKNGIKVGIYFFSAAINEDEAQEEARWVVNVIKKYRITYPVAYDFESFGLGRLQGLTAKQITDNANAFLRYIKSSGYTPMMYASRNAYYQRWETSRITGCKFWLAHYTSKTDYKGTYHMWQYTSKGSVPGISGYVDMNIAYFKFSTEAPAKQPEPDKPIEKPTEKPDDNQNNKPETDNDKPTNKPTLNFNEQKENVIIINENTEYYEDYNSSSLGTLNKDTKLEMIAVSTDNIWAKLNYNGKIIYIKKENLSTAIVEDIE